MKVFFGNDGGVVAIEIGGSWKKKEEDKNR